MWLLSALVFFVVAVGLRQYRERLPWTTWQRLVLALAPLTFALLCVALLLTMPVGMQATDISHATVAGSVVERQGTPQPIGFLAYTGSMSGLILGVPLALTAAPLTFGIRPWPRPAFAAAATILTVLCLLGGASVGSMFLPAAFAAWLPVVAGPRR